MHNAIAECFKKYEADLIAFTQELVRRQSLSDQEGELAAFLRDSMLRLGYDEVFIDASGNVLGRMGSGGKSIQFDSHMDTVAVNDADEWKVPPFSGEIVEGKLYGRGSVDMKGGLAASVYAGLIAKELGLTRDRTVYVSGTVCEEYCDGENLRALYAETGLRPDFVVVCEPSDNLITHGHKGKAQVLITTHGLSAHGSAPEKGLNAVYEMAEIIQRVEALNQRLQGSGPVHGTLVLSDIHCVTASLNAVPSECSIYLDRRLVLGENEDTVRAEMDALVAGKKADWQIGTLRHTTWSGAELVYQPLHAPWKIAPDHPLALACDRAYQATFGQAPQKYDFWDFSTNAVTPVSLGIPCIGFGPGEYKQAHMRDEHCAVSKLGEACRFYAALIGEI